AGYRDPRPAPSRVRLPRLGNSAQDLAAEPVALHARGKVAQRHDPNRLLVAIKNKQPANLVLFHRADRLSDVLVVVAVDDAGRHGVAGGSFPGIAAIGDGADGDI